MPILEAYMVPHPPLIVPDVGKGGEAQIEETTRAYEEVAKRIGDLKPDTVIISSPHATMYADYFHISPGDGAAGSFADFRAPQVEFRETYDTELVRRISFLADKDFFPAGTEGERQRKLDHGTMVPLYFIRKYLKDYKIVRIGLSGLPLAEHYRMGMLIAKAVEETGRRVVYVASGDLSHKLQVHGPYGFAPEGPEYDKRIMDVCSRAAFGELFDFEEHFCEKAAECGHRSFVMMAGALNGRAVEAVKLSHQDVTGVGYGICYFRPGDPDPSREFLKAYYQGLDEKLRMQKEGEDAYVKLARASLESYITKGEVISVPGDLPSEMTSERAGAFVSIHKQGRLRGCIGTILPVTNCVAKEIIQNAISASTRDPRFSPITESEIPYLEINVDVLTKPEDIASPAELDVKKYGVIVSGGGRRGLLLPDLDGVDSVEQQIDIARQKGGIMPDEDVRLQRFEVVRHR
ncbi:MAG: AmmeMemoRadiSam system protein A [Lachnospiraceae bacterium]|nr:AmmeMemoRadiSam system protein A [Lachnospiraceae bacterium]